MRHTVATVDLDGGTVKDPLPEPTGQNESGQCGFRRLRQTIVKSSGQAGKTEIHSICGKNRIELFHRSNRLGRYAASPESNRSGADCR